MDAGIELESDKDYPLVFARDPGEFLFLFTTLADQGLLTRLAARVFRLTPDGWARAEQLRISQPDSDQAFVAM
jgi:hypothetical protein